MSETEGGVQVKEVTFRRHPSKAYEAFVRGLNSHDCDLPQENLTNVLGNAQCREIILNDGSTTFAVHSAPTESAKQILETGIMRMGQRNIGEGLDRATNPARPHFGGTLVLLAGPQEKDQARINTSAMAYEYHGGTSKVVFAFPVSNSGKSEYIGSGVDKTMLGTVDGKFVQYVQDDDSINDSFLIPPEYAFGYFDLESQQFVRNEQFSGFDINKPPVDKSWLRRRLR